jgi:hypothetical protein
LKSLNFEDYINWEVARATRFRIRTGSAPACRLKSPSGGVFSVYDFQEMFRNYLTPDNHKSKAYHLHTGRQLTGNANSLKET